MISPSLSLSIYPLVWVLCFSASQFQIKKTTCFCFLTNLHLKFRHNVSWKHAHHINWMEILTVFGFRRKIDHKANIEQGIDWCHPSRLSEFNCFYLHSMTKNVSSDNNMHSSCNKHKGRAYAFISHEIVNGPTPLCATVTVRLFQTV